MNKNGKKEKLNLKYWMKQLILFKNLSLKGNKDGKYVAIFTRDFCFLIWKVYG